MDSALKETTSRDLQYATHDGVPLYGDLYLPAGPGPHPALMLIHGGAWKLGSKDEYGTSWGPYLARRGYAVFAIDYRLSTERQRTWPQALLDCKAALQYLRGRGAELGIDPNRIGVGGDSAGGELSSMLALTQDWPAFSGRYPQDRFARVSTKVKVVVPAYAVFSMTAWWMWTKKGFSAEDPEYHSLEELFGGTPAEVGGAYFEASPLEYVRCGAKSLGSMALPNEGLKASWFVTWGEEDPIVPAEEQTVTFVNALREAGADVTQAPVPNAGHFWFSEAPLTGGSGVPARAVEPGKFPPPTANDYIADSFLDFLRKKL